MILVYRGLVSINITLLTDLASSETGCFDQYVLPSIFGVNRPAPRSDSATRCPAPAGATLVNCNEVPGGSAERPPSRPHH